MKQVGPKNKNAARGIVSALLQPATTFASASVAGALSITSLWPMTEAFAQQQCTPTGQDQTCVNSQTLSGGAVGISDTGALFTLTNNTSTISGSSFGITANAIAIQSNLGTIASADANGVGVPNGIAVNATTNATIANGKTIQALGAGGIAIKAGNTAQLSNSGTITGDGAAISAATVLITANTGTIEALAAGAGAVGFAIKGDVVTVTNSNMIRENGNGGRAINANVSASSTATVTNRAGGSIIADDNAIDAAAAANVTNAGTIQSANGVAVNSDGAVTIVNLSGGSITGGKIGVQGSGTVTSAGKISGKTASVQFTGSGTNTLNLQQGSELNGAAKGSVDSTKNQLVLQDSGTANNDFLNFNSLTLSSASWTLNGQSFVGTATIDKLGNFTVGDQNHPGAVLTGDVTVSGSASLEGLGKIVGNINVTGGVLRPGIRTGNGNTSAGTMNVTGNVVFAPGSNFIASTTPTAANKLAVVGTATLGGANVVLRSDVAHYAPSTKYTILTATGISGVSPGVIGTFGSKVLNDLAFLKPSITYDTNDVFLTLDVIGAQPGAPGGGFANAAQTRNQRDVAGALDAGVAAVNPVTNPMLLALLNLTSAADARQAFDALSGEVVGSVQSTQLGQMQFARTAMLGRMRQASYDGAPGELGALSFGGPELAYADSDAGANAYASAMAAVPGKAPARPVGPARDLTFWAQGLGGWAHADSDGNAASMKSRFGGFLSGADARLGDSWRAGLVAGYMRTDLNVDDRSSSAGIDSVQFGGYAGGRLGAFNVRGGASYSYDRIDTSRAIFFPGFTDKTTAHFHGNVGQVFGEVGYGMALGHVALEPVAGLAYVHVRDGSFAEAGGLAALSASSANESTGYSTLGVRAATAVPLANGTVLIPRGSVQWQYAFGDVTPVTALAFQSTGTSFTVAGIPIARNAALIEGGFDWRFSPQAKLGAYYQGELSAHAESHAFKGGFTLDF